MRHCKLIIVRLGIYTIRAQLNEMVKLRRCTRMDKMALMQIKIARQ
jgi:hypothetical protein